MDIFVSMEPEDKRIGKDSVDSITSLRKMKDLKWEDRYCR